MTYLWAWIRWRRKERSWADSWSVASRPQGCCADNVLSCWGSARGRGRRRSPGPASPRRTSSSFLLETVPPLLHPRPAIYTHVSRIMFELSSRRVIAWFGCGRLGGSRNFVIRQSVCLLVEQLLTTLQRQKPRWGDQGLQLHVSGDHNATSHSVVTKH